MIPCSLYSLLRLLISIPSPQHSSAAHESRAIVTIGLIPTEWLTVGT